MLSCLHVYLFKVLIVCAWFLIHVGGFTFEKFCIDSHWFLVHVGSFMLEKFCIDSDWFLVHVG